jgi:hypothetical protein
MAGGVRMNPVNGAAVGGGHDLTLEYHWGRGLNTGGSAAVIARAVNHALGGYHTFAADRRFAQHAESLCPGFTADVQANRAFGQRVVRWMFTQGIRQFVDIGCGLPVLGATHETLARSGEAAPVVYVDTDPVVVAFAQNLQPPPANVTAIHADLRHPAALLDHRDLNLDINRPVGMLLVGVLAHVADSNEPKQIIKELAGRLAPGSFIAVSHPVHRPSIRRQQRMLRRLYRTTSTPLHHRTDVQVRAMLDGWRLVAPGLVPVQHWRPESPAARSGDSSTIIGGVVDIPRPTIATSSRQRIERSDRTLPINTAAQPWSSTRLRNTNRGTSDGRPTRPRKRAAIA